MVLFTGRESERRKRINGSVILRFDGFVVRLGLSCPLVPVSSESISSRTELADSLDSYDKNIGLL